MRARTHGQMKRNHSEATDLRPTFVETEQLSTTGVTVADRCGPAIMMFSAGVLVYLCVIHVHPFVVSVGA